MATLRLLCSDFVSGVNGTFSGTVSAASYTGIKGNILQIQSNGFSGAPQTTSGGQVATGHFCNITPFFANSRIMVLYFGSLAQANIYAGNGADAYINMCRNAGALFSGQNMGRMNINTNMGQGSIYGSVAFSFVDAPGSTSQQRYEIYYSCDGGGVAEYNSLGSSTITLLEIAQ